MSPKIIKQPNIFLSDALESLFAKLFKDELEVLIERDLSGSNSDNRVFLVTTKNQDNQMTQVAKIASVTMIKKEWSAYQVYIPKRLRGFTEISRPPVYLDLPNLGALTYPLLGGNQFKTESLFSYCQNASIYEIIHDILEDELFVNLRFLWAQGELKNHYYLAEHYGHLLPYCFILEEQAPVTGNEIYDVNLTTNRIPLCKEGDYVRVVGKNCISSVYPGESAVSLRSTTNLWGQRLLLKCKHDISSYSVDEIIRYQPVCVVKKTRQNIIVDAIQQSTYAVLDLNANTIRLSNEILLPNPLKTLDSLLNQSISVRLSSIHGDLNFENIIVEHFSDVLGQRNHIAHIIDFDNSRRDHVLRDILALEAEILTKLVSAELQKSLLPVEVIYMFYLNLHEVIVEQRDIPLGEIFKMPFQMLLSLRKLARYYLVNPDDWSEYYTCLIIYLVGTLKLRSLDRLPIAPLHKLVAFVGAATIQALLI